MSSSVYIDQLGRGVDIPDNPDRIISLVPSQTELLFDLGLCNEVIAITKFCHHPLALVKGKITVGGTKKVNLNLIRKLQPTLIVGNKEENDRASIEVLMKEFPVWMSDIQTLDDALRMIAGIGEIVNKAEKAQVISNQIIQGFNSISSDTRKLRIAYFIWQSPYMVAGKNTFIDDMINCCGFLNVFAKDRYPIISTDELQTAQPDVIMLSSEPYPFSQKHVKQFKTITPGAKVILVDGEMFSWYGSRLIKSPGYFQQLINQLA